MLSDRTPSSETPRSHRTMWKLSNQPKLLLSLMTASLVGVVFLWIMYTATSSYSQFKYAITIDAGSTHSKAILFKWRADKLNETGVIKQVHTCHISRGIASYAHDRVNTAAGDLMSCIKQLATHLDRATSLEHTFVYLGATAGMRMLNLSDPQASSTVFEAIKTKFVESGLQTKRVSIITGKEEGLFAWVAVNYLSGSLFGHSRFSSEKLNGTYGVLDMGGASAQIAHQIIAGSDGPQDSVHIRLYGTNYTVHTYSNFCFGTEQALKRYLKLTLQKHIDSNANSSQVQVPCLPEGYRMSSLQVEAENVCTREKTVVANDNQMDKRLVEYELEGTSQFDKCHQVVDQILDQGLCENKFQFCFKQTSHPKQGTFYAISAYYYLTDVLNLKDRFGKIDFHQYMQETRRICESSREQLKQHAQLNEKYINKYCFQLTYLHSTLTKVYHFDEKSWPNLRFASFIDDTYLGWVLGFMISESNAIPSEIPISDILLETNLYIIPASILLFIFALSLAIYFWRRLRSKSQAHNSLSFPMSQVA